MTAVLADFGHPTVLRAPSRAAGAVFVPGEAALGSGHVYHRRTGPATHEFSYAVSYVWIDPDDPDELCAGHPLWSSTHSAPARFRRSDYGTSPVGSLADAARDDLATAIGRRPVGPVRMLTQVRRWGWLFNPITVYVVWDDADDDRGDPLEGGGAGPVGAVLEVTNTPWKERTRYPIALTPDPAGEEWWCGSTDKTLHVSPFLDESHRYDVRVRAGAARPDGSRSVELRVDVVPPGADQPLLLTGVTLECEPPSRNALGSALRDLSTHRVSLGIHWEALRLWCKRIPFVPHPEVRSRRTRGKDMSATGVGSDRLLDRARRDTVPAGRWRVRMSGVVMRAILRRARYERLVVTDTTDRSPRTFRYGVPISATDADDATVVASVEVRDPRAFAALLNEGSIGLGRGFIEGWWTSDDPVAVVRFAIRNLAALDRARNRWHRATGWLTDGIRRVRPRDTRERNRDDIGAHYDIGNDFFALFLDETMTYSSGVFATPDASLADASRHKYDLLLDKLGVAAGDELLEIGTGWGGLAIRAATERDARVTTTTISAEQLSEARRRVDELGVADRVTLLATDWRDLDGSYDKVVSIEMIEAVDWRDYDDFFATIERRLRPGGRVALQAICLPDDRWARAKNTEDFIRRFVFPNGYLPSVAAIRDSVARATRLSVVEVDDITPHYAETLRRWRANFDEHIRDVAALGLDERFQRLWRFYLAYCEAGFRERHVRVAQIVLA